MAADSPKTPRVSYAAALSDASPLPFAIDNLLAPYVEEGLISIKISEEPFLRGLESCKNNLVGRVTSPIKTLDLVQQLKKGWSALNEWIAAPLGKGFFMLQFKTLADMQRVWAMGSIQLQQGMLRLIRWSPSFSPSTYKNTFAQVWVRFWDLGFAFWDHQTLFEIASGVGTPLKLDPRTKNCTIGLYARILVDVDFSQPPPDKLRITRANGEVVVIGVEFESVPVICSKCGIVGHAATSCRAMVNVEADPSVPNERGRSVLPVHVITARPDDAAVPESATMQVVVLVPKTVLIDTPMTVTVQPSDHCPFARIPEHIGLETMPSTAPMQTQTKVRPMQQVDEAQASSSLSVPPGFQKPLLGKEQEIIPSDKVSYAGVNRVDLEEGEFTPVVSKKNKKMLKQAATLKPKAATRKIQLGCALYKGEKQKLYQ
ncbi:uncharacterized protein LOC112171573 [Rosa chinensis]|uniref:uncharacterized protein LOC112171573 n=1 Tax=Rosa chinensis TaxID=74649 RepID=UPI000D09640A|nr:uncharacterized protein LOC112171573 [Rosa chinensis]